MLSTVVITCIDVLSILLSISTSVLSIIIAITQPNVSFIIFIISGLLISLMLVVAIIVRFTSKQVFLATVLGQGILSCFYFVTAISLGVKILRNQFHQRRPKNWKPVIALIFIINVVLLTASFVILLLSHIYSDEGTDEESIAELASQTNSGTAAAEPYTVQPADSNKTLGDLEALETKFSGYQVLSKPSLYKESSDHQPFHSHIQIPQYGSVIKKPSDQTLYDTKSDLEHFDDSLANFIKSSLEEHDYTSNNWMETGSSLHINYPEQRVLSDKSRKSFNFLNKRPDTDEAVGSLSYLRSARSVPNFIRSPTINKFIEMAEKPPQGESETATNVPLVESHSHINSINALLESPIEFRKPANHGISDDYVKRSKSTSFINRKGWKREQRWKSIHDERTFLSSVNESLLPPVLKSGESPIMETKRKQEYMESQLTNSTSQSTLVQERPDIQVESNALQTQPRQTLVHSPTHFPAHHSPAHHTPVQVQGVFNDKNNSVTYLSPVGEMYDKMEEDQSPMENDQASEDLPYVASEFTEPVEEDHFNDFDQGLKSVKRNHESSNSDESLYKKRRDDTYTTPSPTGSPEISPPLQYAKKRNPNRQLAHEEYFSSLNGLERIPKLPTAGWIGGTPQPTARINSVTLKEWDENSHRYHEHRSISGANLTIFNPTDHLSVNVDNIDNLSDVPSNGSIRRGMKLEEDLALAEHTKPEEKLNLNLAHSLLENTSKEHKLLRAQAPKSRPSYNHLTRSLSAPSLHTFRNVSDSSKTSDTSYIDSLGDTPNYLAVDLVQCTTPTEIPNSTNSSPIKKFFHESPRRISNVFRRMSTNRHSLDFDVGPMKHKHSSSTVSNQISLSSFVSSKSGSPKKSLKSFLKHRAAPSQQFSHKHTASSPSFSLMAAPPPKPGVFSEAIDFWDLDTTPSSNRSRVSSVPSAVIGEYDKEKWRTLQVLQNQEKLGNI